MPDERFMRHNYGASGYVESVTLTSREQKIARVQQMCTEGFCNISLPDKEAIREVLHLMYDAVAANRAEFDGHKLTVAAWKEDAFLMKKFKREAGIAKEALEAIEGRMCSDHGFGSGCDMMCATHARAALEEIAKDEGAAWMVA